MARKEGKQEDVKETGKEGKGKKGRNKGKKEGRIKKKVGQLAASKGGDEKDRKETAKLQW